MPVSQLLSAVFVLGLLVFPGLAAENLQIFCENNLLTLPASSGKVTSAAVDAGKGVPDSGRL